MFAGIEITEYCLMLKKLHTFQGVTSIYCCRVETVLHKKLTKASSGAIPNIAMRFEYTPLPTVSLDGSADTPVSTPTEGQQGGKWRIAGTKIGSRACKLIKRITVKI